MGRRARRWAWGSVGDSSGPCHLSSSQVRAGWLFAGRPAAGGVPRLLLTGATEAQAQGGCGKPAGTYPPGSHPHIREERGSRRLLEALWAVQGVTSLPPPRPDSHCPEGSGPQSCCSRPLPPSPRPTTSLSTWVGPLLTAPSGECITTPPIPPAVSRDAPLPQGQACLTVSSLPPGGSAWPHT